MFEVTIKGKVGRSGVPAEQQIQEEEALVEKLKTLVEQIPGVALATSKTYHLGTVDLYGNLDSHGLTRESLDG